jgi:fluoride ion exporter CrcB/FEX
MISIVTPFEWGIFFVGLIGCVVFGLIAGVVSTWSLRRKRGK